MSNRQIVLSKNEELILKMAKEEYKDLFPKILEIHENDFMSMLEKYLEISLMPKNIILPSGTLKKILNIIQFQYYQKEFDKINKLINSIESISACEKFNGTNFYPHCNKNKEPIHSCGRKLFILNNYEYLLCLNCKKIYRPKLILLYCKNCSCNFYSGLDNSVNEEDKIFKPATWVKYHCNAIINDIMKCKTCQNIIYLNLNNYKLACKNCKYEIEQNEMKWNCFICQKEFTSEAKIYNPFEYKMIKIALKETLYNMIEAKPDFVPCCNLSQEEIQKHHFVHKNECNGLIYKGYIDNRKIVVCVKCHMLNYFEYHNWLCPICKERFRIKDYIYTGKRNKSENRKSIKNKNDENNKNDNNNQDKNGDNEDIKNKDENDEKFNGRKSNQRRGSNILILNKSSLTEVKKELKNIPKRILSNQIKSKENYINDKSDDNKKEINDFKEKDNNYNITSRNNNYINPVIRKSNYEKNPVRQTKKRLSNISINLNFNLNVDNKTQIPSHYVPINMNSNNLINPRQILNSSVNVSNLNITNSSISNITSNNTMSNFSNISNNINKSNDNSPNNINSKNNTNNTNNSNNNTNNSNNNTNNSNKLNNNTNNTTNSNINTNNTNNTNNSNNNTNNSNKLNNNTNNTNNSNNNTNNTNNSNNNTNNTNNSNNNTNNINNSNNNTNNTNNSNNNINNNINNINSNNPINSNNTISLIKENKFNSDDYNIIAQIGEGTFGKIYKVEGPNKKKYAMKKILANSISEINALQSEYEMLLSLTPYNLNLVNIHGIETKKLDKTTFVMYVLMDIAIRDWEKEILLRNSKKKFYTEKELITILKELIHTFAELQRHKISHRDIKPQNILLFPDNKFKISDFGEAKELMTNNRATIKQTIRGTELYMSPILFRALQKKNMSKYTEHNTFKSDVFSLGLCILFASTLTFNSLCEIRELNNSKDIKFILKRYLEKKYTNKFNDFLFSMLEIDEKFRCDFIELEKKAETL